jgi:hypothetical protein
LLHVKKKFVEGFEPETDSETGIVPVVWIAGVVDERQGRVRDSSNPSYAVLFPVLTRLLHLTSIIIDNRDYIFKLLRSPGIDSKESIPPPNVAWRAGTTTLFLLGS